MSRREGFFDAELISRMRRQELTARRLVDGFLAGKNRSSRHGHSVEFVEHREYSPGDDLRHLDWKVLGRMDRYYIKRYEEETNITAALLVDGSSSMAYGSGVMSKFELAAYTASALAYLLCRQRDSVASAIFDSEIRAIVPPSSKRVTLSHVARQLRGARPEGKTELVPVLDRIAHDLPRRCLFIVVSDFLLPTAEVHEAVRWLAVRGHDAILLQTLDVEEVTFPFRANVLFRGLEDQRELLTEPRRLRARYLEALERHNAELRKAAESAAYDYALISTDESVASVLAATLAARARSGAVVRRGSS